VETEREATSAMEGWLNHLAIDTLPQWDVLAFAYRHRTSLVGADLIARLLGYANGPVVAALDLLDGLGLVERSRAYQGVRLYQFTLPPDRVRRDAFDRLMELADTRVGRLQMSKHLQGAKPEDPERPEELTRLHAPIRPHLPAARPPEHGGEEGGVMWRKAI
jgi:hypothetical protein